jgi:hypothetical protein
VRNPERLHRLVRERDRGRVRLGEIDRVVRRRLLLTAATRDDENYCETFAHDDAQ